MMQVRSTSRGFTLVEVLVAVSLLSLLLGLLFGAMRTGMRSWQAAERRIDAAEVAGQAERFLTRIITQAQPAQGGGGKGTSAMAGRGRGANDASSGIFSGTSERFSVVAPGVDALPRAGLYRYDVFFAPRTGSREAGDLWVRIHPYRPGEESDAAPRLLRENLAGFEVRYFGVVEDREPAEWVEWWPEEADRLPLLVEIRFVPGDGPARAPVIAAPEAAGGV
jgi:general secretion pathway protein J